MSVNRLSVGPCPSDASGPLTRSMSRLRRGPRRVPEESTPRSDRRTRGPMNRSGQRAPPGASPSKDPRRLRGPSAARGRRETSRSPLAQNLRKGPSRRGPSLRRDPSRAMSRRRRESNSPRPLALQSQSGTPSRRENASATKPPHTPRIRRRRDAENRKAYAVITRRRGKSGSVQNGWPPFAERETGLHEGKKRKRHRRK